MTLTSPDSSPDIWKLPSPPVTSLVNVPSESVAVTMAPLTG